MITMVKMTGTSIRSHSSHCLCVWRGDNTSTLFSSVQFSSVTLSCPTLVTPWTAARQASLSLTSSHSLLKFMSIKSVMPTFLESIFIWLQVESAWWSTDSLVVAGGLQSLWAQEAQVRGFWFLGGKWDPSSPSRG